MERIRVTTAAWNDLEKLRGQKSKRKKQAGNFVKHHVALHCTFQMYDCVANYDCRIDHVGGGNPVIPSEARSIPGLDRVRYGFFASF